MKKQLYWTLNKLQQEAFISFVEVISQEKLLEVYI